MSELRNRSMFKFLQKQHMVLGKIQWITNWNMFLLLVFLLIVFCFGGVNGNYGILIWLVALTVILDLFDTAIELAEVGK